MADTIKIEIFKQKNADELTKALADPASRLETGGAAAMTAALAMALLERAADVTAKTQPESERLAWILRNAEILRAYMVHLIDEDVRARNPLRRALKEGDARNIEAARQPGAAIPAEIVNMTGQALELMRELCPLCPKQAMHWLGESAELALAAAKAARLFLLDMADQCSDETYRFVVRRENEIGFAAMRQTADAVLSAVEAAV